MSTEGATLLMNVMMCDMLTVPVVGTAPSQSVCQHMLATTVRVIC